MKLEKLKLKLIPSLTFLFKCNISKEFYTRTRKFSSEKYSSFVRNRWPAERNRIQERYESRFPSFLSPFCQNVFTNIPSPFEGGNGTRYQFHLQNGGGATLPRVFPRRSCYESAKAIQSPHPGLKINEQSWQIPRHARVCPRGSPPPPRMAADKCMTPLSGPYNDMYSNYK